MDRIRSLRVSKTDMAMPTVEEAEKETSSLLRKTQDAVKEVQRRYHGRQDIATNADPSVGILCSQLEQVMLNGLKPPKKRDGEYTFWPAIQLVLTDEDSQALSYLTNISTDSGRSRAWIRWALNERSLEMYLNKLASNVGSLSPLYHELAYVVDEDKMSMLTGLAQGLESVVFALEIDQAELDTVNRYHPKNMQEAPATQKAGGWQMSSSRKDNDAPAALSPDAFTSVPAAQVKVAEDFDPMEAVNAAAKKKKKKKKNKGKSDAPDIGVWGEDKKGQEGGDVNGDSGLGAPTTSASSADSGPPSFGVGIPNASFEDAYLDRSTQPSFASSRATSGSDLSQPRQELEERPSFDDDLPSFGQNGGNGSDDNDNVPNRPLSPGTIAKNALRAARGSMGKADYDAPPSTAAASSAADSTFAPDDLRAVLVGVMRNKDALEDEVRTLEGKLESANHQNEELQRANTELRDRADVGTSGSGGVAQSALEKENELLKVQLKKYVAENTQLKRASRAILEGGGGDPGAVPGGAGAQFFADDDDHTEPDDTVGDFRSIEDMQAHFEDQILTLTQMHCEVMELNDRLHDQLRSRDQQVQILGGIVPKDSGRPTLNPRRMMEAKPAKLGAPTPPLTIKGKNTLVNIWIPAALLRGQGSESYHVYQIFCHVGQDEWNVYRRYTHFADLHRQVSSIFSKISLPRKRTLNRKGAKFVEERRLQLEQYIRHVVQLCLQQTSSPMRLNPCKQTFCEALPFLREKLSGSTQHRQQTQSYGGF